MMDNWLQASVTVSYIDENITLLYTVTEVNRPIQIRNGVLHNDAEHIATQRTEMKHVIASNVAD